MCRLEVSPSACSGWTIWFDVPRAPSARGTFPALFRHKDMFRKQVILLPDRDSLDRSNGVGVGEVIVLQGVPGSSASRDRGQGFTEGIEQFPDITVVAQQTANFDRAEGLNVATNLLQANSGVVGIFCENDEMALGAIEALGDRAGSDVMVVGFDGTEEGIEAVAAGTLEATIAQQPAELGKQSVAEAAKVLAEEDVEEQVSVEVVTLTEDNAGEFE